MENICDGKNNIRFNKLLLYKMAFIYNSLNNGWTIHKKDNQYIFTKKHGGNDDILSDAFLQTFMKANFNIDNLHTFNLNNYDFSLK
jgi:hypothetical protein